MIITFLVIANKEIYCAMEKKLLHSSIARLHCTIMKMKITILYLVIEIANQIAIICYSDAAGYFCFKLCCSRRNYNNTFVSKTDSVFVEYFTLALLITDGETAKCKHNDFQKSTSFVFCFIETLV